MTQCQFFPAYVEFSASVDKAKVQAQPQPEPKEQPVRNGISDSELRQMREYLGRIERLRCRESYAEHCRVNLIKLLRLIGQGHDINTPAQDSTGGAALHFACGLGSMSITNWLLKNGANPSLPNAEGTTPMQCIGSDNRETITGYLREYGAQR